MTYVVHNKKTNEIYTINGEIGEYHNFHQARDIRNTMNDCDAVVRDYEGTTSTYVERPNNWQVIEKPENIKTHEVPVYRSTRCGAGHVQDTQTRASAIGDFKAINRDPAKGKQKTEVTQRTMSDGEAKSIWDEIIRLCGRIERVQERIPDMTSEDLRRSNAIRIIQWKSRICELKMELNQAGR